MTCVELAGLVTEYLEGALAPAQRQRFEAHLQTCPSCARHIEQVGGTVPALALDDLLQVFRAWKREGNGHRPSGPAS